MVEDEPVARRAMLRLLENRGHRVEAAATPHEAFELAAKLSPEILITDWKLGGTLDGVEVAARLSEGGEVSVIMVTAHRLDRLNADIKASGLDPAAVLRKPISILELAEIAESLG